MYLDIHKFGQTLKNIRQKFNYTQLEVTMLLGMNEYTPGLSVETLRRIENGLVIPKFETLELLSSVYKQDLNALLLDYRICDYSLFLDVKKSIEEKLNNNNFDALTTELNRLKNIDNGFLSNYNKILSKQLISFTEAMILYKHKKDNIQALNKLLKAMRINTHAFGLSNYKLFKYSPMEIRILMNIALILNSMGHKMEYENILMFCILDLDFNDEIYPKLCHNLAGVYRRSEDFQHSLIYSNMGIESSLKTGNINILNVLFYGKGIAEYSLNEKGYVETLNKSIILSKTFNQENMAKSIINNCKNVFNIEIA